MSFQKSWDETKKLVQKGGVTPLYVSNVLSIDVDMAKCLMSDWLKLLEHEMNEDVDITPKIDCEVNFEEEWNSLKQSILKQITSMKEMQEVETRQSDYYHQKGIINSLETILEEMLENEIDFPTDEVVNGKKFTQFKLDDLFDALETTWETQADVEKVQIVAKNMLGFSNEAGLFIETKKELFGGSLETYGGEWAKLVEDFFSIEKIKKGNTSTKELKEFFDKEMIEFFEEYKPKIFFNETEIALNDFLNEDISLPFGFSNDT